MLSILCFVTIFAQVFSANHPECGTKGPTSGPSYATYIVGGENTRPLEYPWQISLQHYQSAHGWYHTCGATLINEQWAETAAHCVGGDLDLNNYKVILGEHDFSKVEGTEIELPVTKIIIHEKWNGTAKTNDVALIKLSRKVDLNGNESRVGTACLPNTEDLDVMAEKYCVATGWGRLWYNGTLPDILQKVTVRVWTHSVCVKKYTLQGGKPFIKDCHLCYGGPGASVCNGDSGGPLNCFVKGKWYSYGPHSIVMGLCDGPGNVSVAARNSVFSSWIWATIAKNEP